MGQCTSWSIWKLIVLDAHPWSVWLSRWVNTWVRFSVRVWTVLFSEYLTLCWLWWCIDISTTQTQCSLSDTVAHVYLALQIWTTMKQVINISISFILQRHLCQYVMSYTTNMWFYYSPSLVNTKHQHESYTNTNINIKSHYHLGFVSLIRVS